jgi:SAM-dependent methyltransferase
MDYHDLEFRYRQKYNEIQYADSTNLVSNFYHKYMERGLDKTSFPRVLEIGAGSGEHFGFVRHEYASYIMSDLIHPVLLPRVQEMVENLKVNSKKEILLEMQNIENLSYENCSFDRIIVSCLLHHLSNPVAGLAEVRRVIKDEGLVTIYLPSDPGILYRAAQNLVSNQTFLKFFSKQEIKFLRACQHRNHVASLIDMIESLFEFDDITWTSFPKINIGWNTRFFQICSIRVNKNLNLI